MSYKTNLGILRKRIGSLGFTMIRNTPTNKLIVPLVILSILIATEEKSISFPVIPNESVVNGTVSEYSIVSSHMIGIKPEQVIYRLTITIDFTENINGKPNFLDNKIGQDIKFYSKEKLTPELFGKKVKGLVIFRGDEKGGLFWIRNIEIIK
jgi:hypothetical protein